jgi:hypothetical protein
LGIRIRKRMSTHLSIKRSRTRQQLCEPRPNSENLIIQTHSWRNTL